MTTVEKLYSDRAPSFELGAIQGEIAELKRDLAALAGNAKAGVFDDVMDARAAVEHFGEEASQIYKKLERQGRSSAKAIKHTIGSKPAVSLLLAFAVGFLGGRILLR